MKTNVKLLSLSYILVFDVACSTVAYAASEEIVDEAIFEGWQIFADTCGSCHGRFGEGKIAPHLTKNIKNLSEVEFAHVVANGRGLMPAWKGNEEVMKNMRNMYRYLSARSNGEILEGVPTKN